jgi:hypothetical protein
LLKLAAGALALRAVSETARRVAGKRDEVSDRVCFEIRRHDQQRRKCEQQRERLEIANRIEREIRQQVRVELESPHLFRAAAQGQREETDPGVEIEHAPARGRAVEHLLHERVHEEAIGLEERLHVRAQVEALHGRVHVRVAAQEQEAAAPSLSRHHAEAGQGRHGVPEGRRARSLLGVELRLQ